MNTIVKKTCNVILDILIILFGIVFLVSIYSDIQVKVLKKDHADFFGLSMFEVQTGSMSPNINPSDVIIVKANKSPKVKDIITYKNGKDYITHRVVEAYKGTYVTKGDANNSKDEAIKQEQIVGRVIKVFPKFGVIRKTILNPIVLITLLITVYIISLMFAKKENNLKVDNMIAKVKELFNKIELKDKLEKAKMFIESKIPINTKKEIKLEQEQKQKQEKEEIIEETNIIKERFQDIEATGEELDKTVYYRKVSVDKEDLNPTVPSYDEEDFEKVDLKQAASELEEDLTDDKEALVKLEYLNKKKKKFTNIIEKIMFIKEEELKELILALTNNAKLKSNESSIRNTFIKTYIDGKYYNYCGEVNVSYTAKNMNSKLEELINDTSNSLIKAYKGNDNKYKEKVEYYNNIFSLLLHIETMYLSDCEMEKKITNYKKKLVKYLKPYYPTDEVQVEKIKELILIQNTYSKIDIDTLKKMETNTFELKYHQLSGVKNMYGLTLDHNINFSKIYSDYIVDKTYDEGIVAEDKVLVTANILLSRIAKDMIDTNFKNRYLLYIPESLYEKDNKLNKVLKLIDDENAKKCILILVKYKALINNKKTIKDLKKHGYRIALVFDDYIQVKAKDKNSIPLAEYIFVDKKINKVLGINSMVPSELKQHVITEDILSKVDITGGHN